MLWRLVHLDAVRQNRRKATGSLATLISSIIGSDRWRNIVDQTRPASI